MTVTAEMLDAYPGDLSGSDRNALVRCIEACAECAQACTACADACLREEMVDQLRRCIATDLDCADVCHATGRVVSRQTAEDADLVRSLLQTCISACRTCGTECAAHAEMHEHCRICAAACRRCEDACQALLSTLA